MTTAGGWAPDPDGVYDYRYHDGRNWTDDVATGGVASKAPRVATQPSAERKWAAGWHPDPDGVHEYRYHDGADWTEDVATNGAAARAPRQVVAQPSSDEMSIDSANAVVPAGPPSDAAEGAALAGLCHAYAARCQHVMTAAQSALDTANNAQGAYKMAQSRPQHEISIRNFTQTWQREEDELAHKLAVLHHAIEDARDAGLALASMQTAVGCEMWLAMVLEEETYGMVAAAIEFLRADIGTDSASFVQTIGTINRAIDDSPAYGQPGYLGNVYGSADSAVATFSDADPNSL